MKEFPNFSTFNVCPNGCNIFNGIAGVTKGKMIIYDVFLALREINKKTGKYKHSHLYFVEWILLKICKYFDIRSIILSKSSGIQLKYLGIHFERLSLPQSSVRL